VAVRLRPAREADRQALWGIHSRSVKELCRGAYSSREIATWVALLRPERYLRPGQVVLVAEHARLLVGFAQFNPPAGELEALYVLPEAAGAGVGSALLGAVEAQALEAGVVRLRLDASLNAQAFYERRGYQPVHLNVRVLTPDIQLACVRMEKALGPG
jgi:putative acetyltransferase